MVGCVKGFASLVENQNLYIVRTHCFLHRDVCSAHRHVVFYSDLTSYSVVS